MGSKYLINFKLLENTIEKVKLYLKRTCEQWMGNASATQTQHLLPVKRFESPCFHSNNPYLHVGVKVHLVNSPSVKKTCDSQ